MMARVRCVALGTEVLFALMVAGQRLRVSSAMFAGSDILGFVDQRGSDAAALEFIARGFEEPAQDISLLRKAIGLAHMDLRPDLAEIHPVGEQTAGIRTGSGAIVAEREIAVDLDVWCDLARCSPKLGCDRTDARQNDHVGVHLEIVRDLVVAGEEHR